MIDDYIFPPSVKTVTCIGPDGIKIYSVDEWRIMHPIHPALIEARRRTRIFIVSIALASILVISAVAASFIRS